jgi:hypothetical protein
MVDSFRGQDDAPPGGVRNRIWRKYTDGLSGRTLYLTINYAADWYGLKDFGGCFRLQGWSPLCQRTIMNTPDGGSPEEWVIKLDVSPDSTEFAAFAQAFVTGDRAPRLRANLWSIPEFFLRDMLSFGGRTSTVLLLSRVGSKVGQDEAMEPVLRFLKVARVSRWFRSMTPGDCAIN